MHERTDKIADAIKRYFVAAGFKKAVLGLSGGVDSALVAKLAVMALGKENVTALIMPRSGTSSRRGIEDAKAWAEKLGIEAKIVPITTFVNHYQKLPWGESELARINLQPRIRMTLLYHYANSYQALVLGTGNKTELMLGYFTKYGDGGVDLLPIGNLYKTEVRRMAEAVGVPENIIKKYPSAELSAGQTDEGDIGMSYAEIDTILKKFETGDQARSAKEKKLKKRIKANQHKTQLPLILDSKKY